MEVLTHVEIIMYKIHVFCQHNLCKTDFTDRFCFLVIHLKLCEVFR